MTQPTENSKRIPPRYVGLNVDETTEEQGVSYAPSVRSGILYPLRNAFDALRRYGKDIKLYKHGGQQPKRNS